MIAPLVSICMPSYNRAHVLGETIQHVLNQTFDDFEFLIFDDGSTDGAPEVIRGFSDRRINFLGSKKYGPPEPLNQLVNYAKGKYIIILHDHDIFNSLLIEKSVDILDRHPSAAFVLQGSASVAEDGASNYRDWTLNWPELNEGFLAGAKVLRSDRSIGSPFHACSMIRASAFDDVGRYYEKRYGLYADVDLWFRLLRKYDFCYLRDTLFKFREREKVGHFLEGRNAQVFHSLRLIFLKHGLDYFADEPQSLNLVIENDLKAFRKMKFRSRIKNLIKKTGMLPKTTVKPREI